MLGSAKQGRIIILRHTQTVTTSKTGQRRAIGHYYVPLSEKGLRTAKDFSQVLQTVIATYPKLRLYSSPSQRALESFGDVYTGGLVPIAIVPEAQEIFLGDWEGLPFADIKVQWPDLYEERGANMATFRPPHGTAFGENFEDVQNRMFGVVSSLASHMQSPKDTAILMSHSGCIRSLLCHFQDLPLNNIMQLKVDNLCGLVIDSYEDGTLDLAEPNIYYTDVPNYLP